MTQRHLRVVRAGDPVIESATSVIEADDRRWFEANPFAEFRIRRFVPGENPDPGPTPEGFELWVKITQVMPGVRYRQVGYARYGEMPTEYHPNIDEETRALLEELKASRANK